LGSVPDLLLIELLPKYIKPLKTHTNIVETSPVYRKTIMTAIFISHSSTDNETSAKMKAWLEAQGHTSLFLDFDPEKGIKGDSDWEQTLYQQLRQCQAVIALLTPNWLASKWCFAELVQARERGKAIFPVKVLPCEAGGIFSDIQHIDLTAQPEEGYNGLRIGLLEP
jgi:hypothetical protein